jgi:uncharacterized membrane protein YidH (DUF202 family)
MPSKKSKGKGSAFTTRVKAFIILAAGIVLLVLGIAMWQSPEVTWPDFTGTVGSLGDEFNRLKEDPIAILGIFVIIVAVFLSYYAIKRLIKGKSE